MAKNYQKRKEIARNEANEWLEYESNNAVSWEGVMIAYDHFTKLARRYGLVREFRENAII